jgi:hypothetical protein
MPAPPAADAGRPAPDTAPTGPAKSLKDSDTPPAKAARARRKGRPADGGLRDIVGAGHSQVGVSGALRARDVNRPTEADLAEAERDVVIVRRHWTPDDKH